MSIKRGNPPVSLLPAFSAFGSSGVRAPVRAPVYALDMPAITQLKNIAFYRYRDLEDVREPQPLFDHLADLCLQASRPGLARYFRRLHEDLFMQDNYLTYSNPTFYLNLQEESASRLTRLNLNTLARNLYKIPYLTFGDDAWKEISPLKPTINHVLNLIGRPWLGVPNAPDYFPAPR